MINKLERQRIEEALRRGLSKLEIYESADRGTTHFALEIRDKICYLLSIKRNAKYKGRGVGRELYNIISFFREGREEYWESLGFINIKGYSQMEKVLAEDKNI